MPITEKKKAASIKTEAATAQGFLDFPYLRSPEQLPDRLYKSPDQKVISSEGADPPSDLYMIT